MQPGRVEAPSSDRTAPAARRYPAVLATLAVAFAGAMFLSWTAPGPAWNELAGAIARVAFWGLVLVVAARLGALLTGSRLAGLAHLAWDGAVGLAMLIAAWLVVGLFPGGFTRASIFAVLGVAGAVAFSRRGTASLYGASGAFGPCLLATIGLAGLAWDRVPPLFFDTLAYHFAQPELWLIDGRISPEPWSLHSWFPPGMSVLYGVGLAVGGERLAQDANTLVGLLLVALAWELGRRRFGPLAGAASAAVLVAFPIIVHALGVPAADLSHGMFAGGALAALLVPDAQGEAVGRRRAAWLGAGAMLTKYLGLLVPLALGAVWLAVARRSGPDGPPLAGRVARAGAFLLPALLLVSPWLVANAVVTGNPLAPIGAPAIPTAGLAEGGAAHFRDDARGGWPGLDDVARLGPRLFTGDERESRLYPTPAWGFMPVLLLLGLPLVRPEERSLDLLAVAALAFALWFFSFRWERFLVPTTFLLAVVLGGMLAGAWRRRGIGWALLVVAVLLGLGSLIGSLVQVAVLTGGTPVLLGRESSRAFLARSMPAARLYRLAGERLDPEASQVLFVGEMRHYRLPLRRVAPTGFNAHPLVEALASSGDPAAACHELHRRGFTHLLVDPGWIERSGRRYPSLAPLVVEPARLAALLRSIGPPIAAEGPLALYEVPP